MVSRKWDLNPRPQDYADNTVSIYLDGAAVLSNDITKRQRLTTGLLI